MRRAQCEESVGGQAEVVVSSFRQPSRRCSELSGKIKTAVRHQHRRFPEKKKPSTLTNKVGSGDVLLIRKLPFAHLLPSQALTGYPPASQLGVVSARLGAAPKQNAQHISRCARHSVLATSYSRTACRRTTIGAAAFHFRVRNENGWSHCARVTRGPSRTGT